MHLAPLRHRWLGGHQKQVANNNNADGTIATQPSEQRSSSVLSPVNFFDKHDKMQMAASSRAMDTVKRDTQRYADLDISYIHDPFNNDISVVEKI